MQRILCTVFSRTDIDISTDSFFFFIRLHILVRIGRLPDDLHHPAPPLVPAPCQRRLPRFPVGISHCGLKILLDAPRCRDQETIQAATGLHCPGPNLERPLAPSSTRSISYDSLGPRRWDYR